MPRWSENLDAIASGKSESLQLIETLMLPGLKRWEPGHVWQEWSVRTEVLHPYGAVFGGYLAALADRAFGLVTMSVMGDDETFATSDLRISFFRPVASGVLRIEAEVIHRGRSQVQVECTFTREDGKLAAKASATQVIIPFAAA